MGGTVYFLFLRCGLFMNTLTREIWRFTTDLNQSSRTGDMINSLLFDFLSVCACACVRAYVCACVRARACVCVCVWGDGEKLSDVSMHRHFSPYLCGERHCITFV